MLDYILVVAVGISAGVGALISAIPALQAHTLLLCLLILALITLVNLRGVREAGTAFILPTYLFVGSLFVVLGIGCFKCILTHGHPAALAASPMPITLIIVILIVMLAGIAYLAQAYGVAATEPGSAGYESLISQLVTAVVGRGVFYYVTMGSVIAVLALSANTGFADFPRMCQIISRDGYLPQAFAERGRRLVFSHGITAIAGLSAVLLIIFGGVTDRLIPLFAIGAFLAFTLSQAGMVKHWLKQGESKSHFAIWINGLGALATLVTLLVVLVSKFTEGGWITIILIPAMLLIFYGTRKHYVGVARQVSCRVPLHFDDVRPPIVIVPVRGWSRITRKALQFALCLSPQVYGIHIESEGAGGSIEEQWEKYVTEPATQAGVAPPRLVKRPSPYRKLFSSLLSFIDELEKTDPGRQIAIVIPNLVESKWYHYFLHNQRGVLLRAALRLRADRNLVVVTVPWYLV
jgi:amino acid transporter